MVFQELRPFSLLSRLDPIKPHLLLNSLILATINKAKSSEGMSVDLAALDSGIQCLVCHPQIMGYAFKGVEVGEKH